MMSSKSSSAQPLTAPLSAGERIALLDILRGLALFGMILVHFHQHMRLEAGGVEDLIGWGVWMLLEQKAWGIFAFLFGVGFAVLLRRLESRGASVVSFYLRRLAALAVFGAIAEIVFGFRILLDYALWGVPLLFMRRWSTRALAVAVVVAVCGRWIALELVAVVNGTPPFGDAALSRAAHAVAVAEQQESFTHLLAARAAALLARVPHTWRAFLPDNNLPLFVLGLLALRHGVIEQPKRHVRVIGGFMIFGVLSWAAAWTADFVVQPRLPKMPVPGMEWPLLRAFGLADDQWLSLTYVGAVTLLLAYRPWWIARLSVFGQAGRMALTNYMLQIAVLDVLASGYGFSLKLRPYVYVVAAVLLFSAEAAFSRVWLSRYRFGPLEWVWRTATYMRPQPLRREASAAAQMLV